MKPQTTWLWPLITMLIAGMLWTTVSLGVEAVPKKKAVSEPVTTKDIDIPLDELELLVKPLTSDELLIEADAWLKLLKNKVKDVIAAEIAVKQKNNEIKKTKEVKKQIEDAKETLDVVKKTAHTTQSDTTGKMAEETVEAAEKAQQAVKEVAETIDDALATAQDVAQDETVQRALNATGVEAPLKEDSRESVEAGKTVREAQSATAAVTQAAKDTQAAEEQGKHAEMKYKAEQTADAAEDAQQALDTTRDVIKAGVEQSTRAMARRMADTEKLDQLGTKAEKAVEANADVKTQILDAVADLRTHRTALIDRFNVVLDELNAKLGKTPEGKDNEVVVPYRLYAGSVGGIIVDVSDREAAQAMIIGWLKSTEGGVRWLKHIAVFLCTVLAFFILGWILGKLTEKAFRISKSSSILLRSFVVSSVRRVTLIIGLIIGLAALEINIGPVLAVIGAAGFVVAFALQDTLSNFASGIMIMLYNPFDVDDFVDVAGVMGVVRSMTLVSTTITTADNKIMIVPNNSIWGNIITNITGSEQRRVDLVFRIGYNDDIGHARQVLEDAVSEHPLVLDEPEPMIQVHELAASSVNFICRPWAKTKDYWTVYWDLTRIVKERFDAEGISIPFMQQDVHFFREAQKAPCEAASKPE